MKNQPLGRRLTLVLTAIPTDRGWREKPRFRLGVNTPDVSRLFAMDYLERAVRYHILDIFHSLFKNLSAELSS